ncbi:MAG: hypothetical protein O3B24_01660, partial [Verrucomicrobia bacterium]|nr:hypothetical protein [Verrucomicrobiota bacterium]
MMPDAAPTAPRPHAIPLTGWLLTAAAAIIAQVLFVASTADELPFQIPTVDSATYHAQALAIAQNRPAPRVPFWQPPLYPYTLAALYALGITSMTAVRLVHGLSALCTALLVLCVARRVTTPRIATAAAITTSLYGPMLFFTTQLLPTGLAVATGMAALLAYLRLREAPTRRRAGICGATYALAALAVPNILACLILPVLHLARRRAWHLLAVCLAGAALLILPVTLRNRVIGGDWVLISTNAGINLYIGNNEQTTLTLTARPGQDWDRLTQMPYTHGATSPAESQRWFLREFFHYATTSPLHFCCGLANKTWLLLGAAELPRNLDLYVFRPFSWMHALLTWRLPWFAFPFGLVGPLALLGILTSFRANRPARTITAHATIYALTLILFYPAARYRLPLIPPLLILAAVG